MVHQGTIIKKSRCFKQTKKRDTRFLSNTLSMLNMVHQNIDKCSTLNYDLVFIVRHEWKKKV